MTDKTKPVKGKVVNRGAQSFKDLTPGEVIDAIREIVTIARDAKAEHDEHVTERQRLKVFETNEVARIKAVENTVRHYFDLVFAERREVHQALFARMDRAMDEGNADAFHSAVTGIVELAKTSPLADTADLGKVAAAFTNPDTVYEL